MLISLCLKAYLSEMSNLLFFIFDDKKYIFNFENETNHQCRIKFIMN